MGEQPFAVASWIVASGILYYILPREILTICEDKLRQIIDLGQLVDCYRWIVACLSAVCYLLFLVCVLPL